MSGYEPCGLGVCAANAGHEGPCAVVSGWADEEELWAEVARLRDQRDTLAARLAAVEALADRMAKIHNRLHGDVEINHHEHLRSARDHVRTLHDDLRAALDEGNDRG